MPRKPLALLLLLSLLLAGCGKTPPADPYALTLWYAQDDPLAPALELLADGYNAARGRDTLPLTLRAFESEERLLAALQSGAAPALALLGHEAAFTLARAGLLVDPGLSPDYPAWLRERESCIGHGYFPLGFSLPLLCFSEDAPAPLSALLREAARQTQPRLYIEAFAPVFYQAMLDEGLEFTADFERGARDSDYAKLYNAVAEAAFTGGLSLSPDAAVPWRIGESYSLCGMALDTLTPRPLSEGELLGEARGLAVTVRDSRMRRALPALLRWFFEGGQCSPAMLAAGFIPALPDTVKAGDPLAETLLSLRERPLHLPDGGSAYARNRADFETRVTAALALLD